jgi:hypothetical protein
VAGPGGAVAAAEVKPAAEGDAHAVSRQLPDAPTAMSHLITSAPAPPHSGFRTFSHFNVQGRYWVLFAYPITATPARCPAMRSLIVSPISVHSVMSAPRRPTAARTR